MIILFHWFTKFLYNLFKKRINERNSSWSNFTITKLNSHCHPLAQRDLENDIKFDPPVYKQRYERATDVLTHEKWKDQINKLVDFGCAEFGFFVFLKNTIQTKEITFVDVDEQLLRDCIYRVYPLNADYLVNRPNPLTVKVFAGSVANPDPVLVDTDAIVALELIEHLYPDVLEAFPYNIFSYVQPKLVIVTTPNVEFNVLFEKLKTFRHADHKFEWTREQFQSWATNITSRFPRYVVKFDGIGLGPTGLESVGCCSQLAVFIRKDIICDNYTNQVLPCICVGSTCMSSDSLDGICCSCKCWGCVPKRSYGICTYNSLSKNLLSNHDSAKNEQDDSYKLIATVEYPYEVDTRTEEEKILDELKYRMHLFDSINSDYYNAKENRLEIPLNKLTYQTVRPFPPEIEIRNLLLKFNYKIEECLNRETERFESCVIYEPEMENGGSGSDTEASGYESDSNKYNVDDAQLSDWDENDLTSWNSQSNKDNEVVANKEGVKTQLHLEVSGSKKQQGALFDSGYQKSPSVPDESPQSLSGNQEAVPLEFKSLNSDNKPTKLSNILSVFDNFDKINELDAVRKERKYFNFASNLPHREVMKKLCQEIVKHPIPGPSRDPKRSKPKKSHSSDSDDSVEDVKSITTCILENSLNKIEVKDEERQRGDLIQELIPEELPPEEVPVQQDEVVEPLLIVENGDLANNNRDLEGNNYPAENAENPLPQNDNAQDNLELDNVNIDNNNEIVDLVPVAEAEAAEEVVEENIEIEPPVNVEVAWSSREALFDVNSHVDLLEDFDMDASVAVVNGVVFPSSYVVVTDSSLVNEADI
ncbi:uncharacterized protein [Tenebrio molitor]|uniref:uncharacterized protein isoform X4 n=1 Tax=Tenebrio molitor TaxID=7067 RepID=UPI00362490C5